MSPRRQAAKRLEPLHIPAALAPRLFFVLRLSVGFALATALVLLGHGYFDISAMPSLAGLGSLGATLGWKTPHFVAARLALRRRSGARGLAEAIELLVISVEAGLSLEDAVNRIVHELRRSQPAMAEELALTGAARPGRRHRRGRPGHRGT